MLRVALGSAVLAAGLYLVFGEHLAGVSANATVNARLTTIRAPISGEVAFAFDQIGTLVQRRERIGQIRDLRSDNSRLSDLSLRREQLGAEIEKVQAERKAVQTARGSLAAHVSAYKRGRIDQLHARIDEARAQIDVAEAQEREARQALKRARALRERSVATAASLEKAEAAHEVAVKRSEAARQREAFLQVELKAARRGTYLGDSYNDAPYSWQQIQRLDLRLQELDAEFNSLRKRRERVQTEIDSTRVKISRMSHAELQAPVNGMVWDFLANTGEMVRQGQDLLRIVDCDSAIVTASVSERLFNRLKRGDTAQFRLLGGERVYEAAVVRLAGSGARGRYDTLAVSAGEEQLTRFDVLLSIQDPSFISGPGCSVGRTGRVVFSKTPAETLRELALQVGL